MIETKGIDEEGCRYREAEAKGFIYFCSLGPFWRYA